MTNVIIIFIHQLAAATVLGSLIYCLMVYLPAAEKNRDGATVTMTSRRRDDDGDRGDGDGGRAGGNDIGSDDDRDENSPAYKILNLLTPTTFASILILIGSGVYYLLENYTAQSGLKPGYYNLFGVKMLFVALAFFPSMYMTFSLRVRIADLDLNPAGKKLVPQTIKKMIGLSQITLWMVAAAMFLGIWLARY